MNKGLILLANGFEESEAIITIDLLRRAHIDLDLVSMDKELTVTSSHKIKMIADKTYLDIFLGDYNFLIIPGGNAVFDFHLKSQLTKSIVNYFYEKHLLIVCICAAPLILEQAGYLKNKKYSMFPSCHDNSFDGEYIEQSTIQDGLIITSCAMGTTFDFALQIIKYLAGETISQQIKDTVYYQNTTK